MPIINFLTESMQTFKYYQPTAGANVQELAL